MTERLPHSPSYDILSVPERREMLKERCIEMVHAAQDVDAMIFLDKNARPLVTVFRPLFKRFYPDKGTPRIMFLNVGREKFLHWTGKSVGSVNDIPNLSIDDLIELYGEENIQQLTKLLYSSKPERRLVIDDAVDTGNTRRLLQRITEVIDPTNQYFYFALIGPQEVYDVHGRPKGLGSTQWGPSLTLVESQNDFSFLTRPQKDSQVRTKGIRLRDELKRLAEEIIHESQKS